MPETGRNIRRVKDQRHRCPLLFKIFIYLAALVLVVECRIFSCSMWDLVPRPGMEPSPLHWECRVLAIGPLGKSHLCPLKTSKFRGGER